MRLPPKPPDTPEDRKHVTGFGWLCFLVEMQQHQVDALQFGVDPDDEAEWTSFARWYIGFSQKPAYKHTRGTVFPLTPDELRARLRKPH